MKLSIERAAALTAVARVQAVADGKGTIPILANVLLSAKGESLGLAGSDLDIGITCEAAAVVDVPGAITVPGKRFYEIIKNLPLGAELGLELVDRRMIVRAGRSRFQLATLPAADFPAVQIESGGIRGEVRAKDLQRLLRLASYAVSSEAVRYYLNGIYLHAEAIPGAVLLRAASTDGHRMAVVECPCPEQLAGMPPMIIPRKTVPEILKLLDGPPDAMVEIACAAGKQIAFSVHGVELISRLVDGNFPDYRRIVPTGLPHAFDVDVALLAQAVKRVALLATADKVRAVKVAIRPGQIEIRARDNTDGSEASEVVEIDYGGPEGSFGFNAAYLADVLEQMSGRTVRAEFGGANDAWKILDPVDQAVRHVLMPLRA